MTNSAPQRTSLRAISHLLAASVIALSVGACGAKITKHGHHLRATDIQQIQPGMGEDEVRLALGTPATTSQRPEGKSYYYISSTMAQTAFFRPTETERKVLAVYFSPLGTVQRVANYGLKDGKVFDFINRETPPANGGDSNIIQQLFRNIGRPTVPIAGG